MLNMQQFKYNEPGTSRDNGPPTRTVRLLRGTKGFGFNLAGELPCYLSAVHDNSASSAAGLKTGNCILSINGMDVTNFTHCDIVQLIAQHSIDDESGSQFLELVVMGDTDANDEEESDSSSRDEADSDVEVWRRQKLRSQARSVEYLLRANRSHKNRKSGVRIRKRTTSGRLDENHSNSLPHFQYHMRSMKHSKSGIHVHNARQYQSMRSQYLGGTKAKLSGLRSHTSLNRSFSEPDYLNSIRNGTTSPGLIKHSNPSAHLSMIAHAGVGEGGEASSSSDSEESVEGNQVPIIHSDSYGSSTTAAEDERDLGDGLLIKAVVVYIGAVPISYPYRSRQQVIRHGLQSLRAQKVKAPTVLLEIYTHQVVITNTKEEVIARFSANSLLFVAACSQNKQYFSVATKFPSSQPDDSNVTMTDTTTSGTGDESWSNVTPHGGGICHLFAVDPQLHLHSLHYHYAKRFHIRCTKDPQTNMCLEFPYISTPVLHSLYFVYKTAQAQIQAMKAAAAAQRHGRPISTQMSTGYTSSNNSDSGIGGNRPEGSSLRLRQQAAMSMSEKKQVSVRLRNGPGRVRFADEVPSYEQQGSHTGFKLPQRSGPGPPIALKPKLPLPAKNENSNLASVGCRGAVVVVPNETSNFFQRPRASSMKKLPVTKNINRMIQKV